MRLPFRFTLLGSIALACGACTTVDSTLYNLEQLHPAPGQHAHAARMMGATQFEVRRVVSEGLEALGTSLADIDERPVDDPVETCLELLNDMRSWNATRFGIASTQVEQFARIALNDPWALSRELAVRELGVAGARIDAAKIVASPIAEVQPSREEFEAAQREVVESGLAALDDGTSESRARFERACDGLANLGLDVDLALEALADLNVVLRRAVDDDERTAPLRKLALVLQRRVIDSVLQRTLADSAPLGVQGSDPGWPNDRVQAASVEANVAVFGAERLAAIMALNPFRAREDERLIAVLEAIEQHGLPAANDEQTKALGGNAHHAWTATIVKTAAEHPEGRVRLAAMRALGKISGKGAFSLRFNDWYTWWIEEGSQALQASAGSAASERVTP